MLVGFITACFLEKFGGIKEIEPNSKSGIEAKILVLYNVCTDETVCQQRWRLKLL